MGKRKIAVVALALAITGNCSIHGALADAQYTAIDSSKQTIKQGTIQDENEFLAFDGLQYSIVGDFGTNQGIDSYAYIIGNGTVASITGNINASEGFGTAIEVEEQSSVIIQGNILGDTRNFDSMLEIHGDIDHRFSDGMPAVFAFGEVGNGIGYKTQTTVYGNIKSAGRGIKLNDGGHAVIVGNIDAGLDGIQVGDLDDDITEGASCEVIGDIHAERDGVIVYQSQNPRVSSEPWIDGINSVIVKGNISAGNDGIIAQGQIFVEGNVNGKQTAIRLENEANVIIQGNVTSDMIEIDYTDTEYYDAYGEWHTYYGDGVVSFVDDPFEPSANNARIQIIGDVHSTGACFFMECGEAYVCGSVKSDYQTPIIIRSVLPSTIEIDGSVLGNTRAGAISVVPSKDNTLIVKGSVIARGNQSAIEIYDWNTDTSGYSLAQMPRMIVKDLIVENGEYVSAVTHDENGEEIASMELAELATAAIQYIIDVKESEYGKIDVSGYTKQDGLMLAQEGKQLTVHVTPNPGYMIANVSAGSKADVLRNDDDTFTVTVKRGGGLTISAEICQIPSLPQTGDQSHIELSIALFAASVIMLMRIIGIAKQGKA